MILCVDVNALKTSDEVQRDVDLEDIINNHTDYFASVEEAIDNNYVPLDFSVSIRTVFTNLVAQIDDDITQDGLKKKSYYVNMTNVDRFIHKGYDLIMYLSSLGIMHYVKYQKGFDECMMKYSDFIPIGIYNPDPAILNPIVYSHVIISDEGAEDFRTFMHEGVSFVPIRNISTWGNLKALLDTLIYIKEEDNDGTESNYH